MGANNQDKRRARKKARVARAKKAEARKASLPTVQVRPCNGCTACCSVFGVHEIEKQPWTDCQHQIETGCAVYQDRPAMCKSFYCLWQTGLGETFDRPDSIGVIFAPTNGKTPFTGEMEVQAYELHEGAALLSKPATIISRLVSKGALVIVHTHGGAKYRLMGPEKKVADAAAFFRKKTPTP